MIPMLIGFAMIALWQILDLVQKRWWKELIAFTVLWSAGLIFSVMILVGIRIPPISTIITKLLTGL